MKSALREVYATLRTEGAILPPDLLQRVADGDKNLAGLTPADYHCEGEKLNEVASRAWQRLQGRWAAFEAQREGAPPSDPATTITRERWLLPLFQELGYGRLQTTSAIVVDGKDFPVSHLWSPVPIHLVGCNIKLDTRTTGVAGAARTSPHSLVQDLLNHSDDRLWAFVSNGLQLRILRDNVSLSRQAYVEFDLEAMMRGELYADFVLMWLLCHESRVEGDKPEECWLERWSQEAQQQGLRALDGLRKGVEKTIETLGQGFLAHKANRVLLEKLRSGELDNVEYYRQLLRLVYRLLFLLTAEDRGLLLLPLPEGEGEEVERVLAARERYLRFYSSAQLRDLAAKRRGSRHSDLYGGLGLVMRWLGSDEGCPELALPALGSFLFSDQALPDLDDCRLANSDLLEAVRALAFTVDGGTLRPIDFRNLGAEELGSVYESLLEMQPELNREAATFALKVVSGSERKTTGSYYTPSSLIQCLLDSALDPVVDDRLAEATKGVTGAEERRAAAQAALLDLKICDPACGSGHFLIAAAHRLARRLAGVRTGDDEPAPEATRQALRDVIGHCIYGVDINPMAVELCKVNLWMEALEPGKPLSFLDHRIQCGNSLLGATPALLRGGIPDGAFNEVEGDDKETCRALARQNKRERSEAQTSLFGADLEPWSQVGGLPAEMSTLDGIDDSTLEGVLLKGERFATLTHSQAYTSARFLADAWCAAFAQEKTAEAYGITQEVFRRIEQNPDSVPQRVRETVLELANTYGFFHWHLAFPSVFRQPEVDGEMVNPATGWSGGFDVMLGNPPWDTLSPDLKEFFSAYDPNVRFVKKAEQQRIVSELLRDARIAEAWADHRRRLFVTVHFLKESGRYRLFAPGNLGKGDFDMYRMFVETAMETTNSKGFASQVVKSGLYNGANAAGIRKELLDNWDWRVVLGFVNEGKRWFPGIHPEQRFCVYSAKRGGPTVEIGCAFGLVHPSSLQSAIRQLTPVTTESIRAQSPDSLAIPETSGGTDSAIAAKMYAAWPPFGDQAAGPPSRTYQREIDMGTDRDQFGEDPDGYPLYEGRMVDRYDYRAKAYRSGRGRAAVWEPLAFSSHAKKIVSQWTVYREAVPNKIGDRWCKYRIGFCDVASPTLPRALVATLIPPNVVCGHTVPTISFGEGEEWAYIPWLAVANSFCMDFLVRKKVTLHMGLNDLDSLPFPRWSRPGDVPWRLAHLALCLQCTGPEMDDFWDYASQSGWCDPGQLRSADGGIFDIRGRVEAAAEVEALVAHHVFGLTVDDLTFIFDTFDKVEAAETAEFGEFLSRRVAVEQLAALRSQAVVSVQA